MNAKPYMHSVLWCCTSCGFVLEGRQPHMECPICGAYKSAYIDSPAHIEAELREEFGELSNGADARKARLTRLREGGYTRTYRLKGRCTEAVHHPDESRRYT